MYRQQQREMATVEETQANQHFISRCAGYPVVATALQQVTGLYEKTKESNQLVKYTLETAESGVKVVASTAKPVVNKLEKPISSLDSFACSQLDKLERSYPTITKPTEQVLEEGHQVYDKNLKPTVDKISGAYHYGVDKVTAVKDYSTSKVTAVKDYSVNKACAVKNYTQEQVDAVMQFGIAKINDTTGSVQNKVNTMLASPTGQKVMGGVNTVIDKAEDYVERYLPEEKKTGEQKEDEGEEEMEVDSVETEPATHALKRVSSLTDKMRRRMFTRAMKDMRNLQTRSTETIQKLNFTVNLMDYARDHIDSAKAKVGDGYTATKDRLNFYWEELNRTGEELEMEDFSKEGESDDKEGSAEEGKRTVTPTNLELKALATARHLSMQLKHTVSATSERVNQLIPESVHQRIHAAKTYTEDLVTQFSKAQNLKDLPQTVLAQTKEKLAYIQETVAVIVTNYNPLTWALPKNSPESDGSPGDEEKSKKNEEESKKDD